MTNSNSVSDLLLASEAFCSLRAEQEVVACLEKLGWRAVQSPYYMDGKTSKLRELDVVASKHWVVRRKAGDLHARIKILVEVKSNSDFHVLLAGNGGFFHSFGENEYWIGYCEDTQKSIADRLLKREIAREEILDFLTYVEEVAFPRHTMRTAVLRLSPPPVEHCYSAFRETNIKTEKDLDNSVVWRAASALRSAVLSAKQDGIDGMLQDLETAVEMCRRYQEPLSDAIEPIDRESRSIDMYLPVVVIQSRIWSAIGKTPAELKWARLIQHGIAGDSQTWFDVVNLDYWEEYLTMQSSYFEKEFRKAKAKRFV